jgi:cysteinyl-tRNA synthetase
MHNAWITASGEKMSKSLSNSMLVTEVVKHVRPVELRYYLVQSHYRSNVEFSYEALDEAAAAFRRIEGFIGRAVEQVGPGEPAEKMPEEFAAAMDDDLSAPAAMAVIHDAVHRGNSALTRGDDSVAAHLADVRAMLAIFGLDPLAEPWASRSAGASEGTGVIDALVAALLQQREDARVRKDYTAADAVRDQLGAAGVEVEDTANGPRWSLRR